MAEEEYESIDDLFNRFNKLINDELQRQLEPLNKLLKEQNAKCDVQIKKIRAMMKKGEEYAIR